ncbi:MFS transporter [Serratia sp. M24T3]|uniref:MFS transporter n=1 Tax=Serratia sp. M24T3 TaxID=932213 RepID=UPI00025BAA9C|nr:MFS transporter [Serratia sp. M24T3]EIC85646.1 major facilitator superfamily protein [Serratia sp. M24T3]
MVDAVIDKTAKDNKYWVLGLLYTAWCIAFIDRVVLSFSSPAIAKELSLSPTEIGLVLSIFYFGFWLMQLPGGWLADRFGSKVIVMIGIGCWSLFTLFTGTAWSLTSLLAIRLLFGIGEGIFPSASIKGVTENFSLEDKPKMSSFLMSSNYIGSMLAPLLIAPLLIHFGWRHVFMMIGGLGILFVLVYGFTVRRKESTTQAHQRMNGADLKELLRKPLMWKLAAVWFGLSLINKGLDSWMPIYLMTERGMNLKAVGILLPIPYLTAGIATMIGGWVMIKFFDGKEKYMLMVSAALTAFFLYFMYGAQSISAVIAAQACVYFFKSFVFAVAIALPTKILAEKMVGTGIGIINFGGQAAGFVAPLAIGILVQHFSYSAAFLFLMAAAACSVIISVTLRTPTSKQIKAGQF